MAPDAIVPFERRLRELLSERNWTADDLAFAVRRDAGERMSAAAINKYLQGDPERKPKTPERYEAIAIALGVDAREFAEYRLAVARRLLSEREVGLVAAVEALDAVEDGLAALSPGVVPPPPEGPIRRLAEQQTSARGRAPRATAADARRR